MTSPAGVIGCACGCGDVVTPGVTYVRGHNPRRVTQKIPLADRFWPKVDVRGPDECWPWLAAGRADGYGYIGKGGRGEGALLAHRVAYELTIGPIPEGLVLDHVKDRGCTGGLCCNPAHLEPVTQRENILRGHGASAINARKTQCPQGHPYSGPNLYVTKGGQRRCRTCQREARRRYREGRQRGPAQP